MLETPSPEVARAGLRALKTVATIDGHLHDLERDLLESLQRFVLGSAWDLDELAPIEPEALAREVPPAFRARVVEGCILMTLIDGEAGAPEVDLVDRYAAALGVRDRSLATLHGYVDGNLRWMRFDLLRRFILADRLKREWRERGLRGLWRLASTALRGGDPAVAARYRELEGYPEGTLGREYFEFIRRSGFALPGEPGSPPELVVFHDCNHVLGGYGTSPVEETQVAAFHAGHRTEDKFGLMLFILMQFHLGVRITPTTEGVKDVVVPRLIFEAFERGARVNRDLIATWEPRDDFRRPVDELRKELNVLPRGAGA